jgi:homopolymeric O-antigen transport system permease protein
VTDAIAPHRSPELVMTSPRTPALQLVRNVYGARELISILGRKNFFVQYRRASIGVLWSVGLPLLQAVTFAVIFSRIARFAVPNYAVYVFSGMVAWSFFLGTLLPGATSIVDNAGLSSKVYFPRAVLPLSVCFGGLYSLAAGLIVLIGFALARGAGIGVRILWLVPGIALLAALSAAFALVLSVSHVYLRDTRYVVQAASIVWLWITPVIYPITSMHGWVRTIIDVNPMTGVVLLFHAAVLHSPGPLRLAWVSVAWTVAFAVAAVVLHARYDRVVSDLL